MLFCITANYTPQALNALMDNPNTSRFEEICDCRILLLLIPELHGCRGDPKPSRRRDRDRRPDKCGTVHGIRCSEGHPAHASSFTRRSSYRSEESGGDSGFVQGGRSIGTARSSQMR